MYSLSLFITSIHITDNEKKTQSALSKGAFQFLCGLEGCLIFD